ncbi:Crp/Fnr family transcriptional regulator [Clostridium botulinum]|uniref:Transcriptional regulator, Crp/Fnr family n=1 Tax=Clostridium botulinum (strain Kyoto / Type A2) TaxID=536232 RepID=C1FLI9_CLOBJ|nr:Crp/Fnr family transcriptional regulator [Clostridium botulinum]ACO84367.1 transcriptional regulator, Crp/Fnr family [Clostridium botulinum A2 str. Kyoto]APH22396.1 bacterial regulatory s, crp family protein [Clostridium botulinum]APQ70672.1 bacterial regulatory s, crp family protein [Clostridium botulinum]AUN06513.1 Crp/Fnr family transcriptional regulator [Clostridium botulinum]EPS56911.1 Crp/Fnr family transcriptional regulator [Clostridium botulinum Af84]
MVKKNRFLPGSSIDINSDFYKIFEEAGTIKKYNKDEIIYFQEDVAENFYLIKSGRVRMFLISPEGTELTIEILRKGKLFGESSCFSYGSRLTSVSAATDVELISVSLENLYPYLTKYPELMVQMFHLMSLTMKNLSIQVSNMAFLPAEKKLAQLLVRLGAHFKKNKNDKYYIIDYSHEEIAQLIGSCRVTVTKILNSFQEKGMISLGYKKIKIIDEKGLKKEYYHYFV